MGIFSRLSDIVNSNITALLDQAEDPAKIIRLIIQEMQETLYEVRATAAKTIAEKKEIQRALRRFAEAQADWQRKAEVALSNDREDLSRGALIEKAKLAAAAAELEEELALLEEALGQRDADIAKLQAKLSEAEAKQKTVRARHETASSRLKLRRQIHDERLEDAFQRFEQMERRLDHMEGEAEAFDLGQIKTLSEEIADLEVNSAIEDELSALKSRLAEGRARANTKAN